MWLAVCTGAAVLATPVALAKRIGAQQLPSCDPAKQIAITRLFTKAAGNQMPSCDPAKQIVITRLFKKAAAI